MNDFSENNDVNIKLNNILKNRFGIDLFNNDFDVDIDENLLSRKFKLRARDLIYLLNDVEKEFNITVSDDDIDKIKFNTVRNITTIINKELNKREMDLLDVESCNN